MNFGNAVALHQLWQWYVTEGPGDFRHAASWELCIALVTVMEAVNPRTIVDTGSGLTSIVTQLWADKNGARSMHFESDEAWAVKTEQALRHHGLEPAVIRWDGDIAPSCDLLIHDYGTPDMRVATMDVVCRAGRVVVADDFHFPQVAQAAIDTGREWRELKGTRDGYGRWAAISMPRVIG